MTYITGVGKTKFGVLDKSLIQLASEAIIKALKDSQLSIMDIKAIYVGNFLAGILDNQQHLNSMLSSLFPELHLPIIRIEAACASGGVALHQAILSLNRYDPILIIGVEKMTGYDNLLLSKAISSAGDVEIDQKNGLTFPASYALIAQKYLEKYGCTMEDLASIALKAHHNANLNPLSHFYLKKVDLEMVRQSPIVSSPLRLFDCSPISDGAAAVIISQKSNSPRDVMIKASCLRTDTISISQRKDITTFTASRKAAEEAYDLAHVHPSEIDVAEVHDCFTIAELIAMEDINFCSIGDAKSMTRAGKTEIGGSIPINPSGGLKANGHPIGATGISQVCEIVAQLRDEAGGYQVKNARIGLTHNVGGTGGTAVIHILEKKS